MKLLQSDPLIQVLKPESLRVTMKQWTKDMYEYYKDARDISAPTEMN